MISLDEALLVHKKSIEKFGGSHGVFDLGKLESALGRPMQSFDGEWLYPTIIEKAAALGESIIKNHPFIDGNKRTGYLLMEAILRMEGIKIVAPDEELYEFVIRIATGEYSFDSIVDWLVLNTSAMI